MPPSPMEWWWQKAANLDHNAMLVDANCKISLVQGHLHHVATLRDMCLHKSEILRFSSADLSACAAFAGDHFSEEERASPQRFDEAVCAHADGLPSSYNCACFPYCSVSPLSGPPGYGRHRRRHATEALHLAYAERDVAALEALRASMGNHQDLAACRMLADVRVPHEDKLAIYEAARDGDVDALAALWPKHAADMPYLVLRADRDGNAIAPQERWLMYAARRRMLEATASPARFRVGANEVTPKTWEDTLLALRQPEEATFRLVVVANLLLFGAKMSPVEARLVELLGLDAPRLFAEARYEHVVASAAGRRPTRQPFVSLDRYGRLVVNKAPVRVKTSLPPVEARLYRLALNRAMLWYLCVTRANKKCDLPDPAFPRSSPESAPKAVQADDDEATRDEKRRRLYEHPLRRIDESIAFAEKRNDPAQVAHYVELRSGVELARKRGTVPNLDGCDYQPPPTKRRAGVLRLGAPVPIPEDPVRVGERVLPNETGGGAPKVFAPIRRCVRTRKHAREAPTDASVVAHAKAREALFGGVEAERAASAALPALEAQSLGGGTKRVRQEAVPFGRGAKRSTFVDRQGALCATLRNEFPNVAQRLFDLYVREFYDGSRGAQALEALIERQQRVERALS